MEVELLKAEKGNKLSKDIGIRMGRQRAAALAASPPEEVAKVNAEIADLQKQSKSRDDRIKELEDEQNTVVKVEKRREQKLAWVPNIPHSNFRCQRARRPSII